MSTSQKALEAFESQNPELAQLEGLLSRFNLFEAIGVVRQELRHSYLLAFLLDPSRNHGMGATFLKELLQVLLLTMKGKIAIVQSDIDSWNLRQAVVERERDCIDIFIRDDVNHFAVIIENKIDTGEHSDQLSRYYEAISSQHPGYKVLALFLTPTGVAPSDDRYVAVSYSDVCRAVENLLRTFGSTLDSEIVMLLEHYAQMLRIHIMSDTEVAKLCRSIYQKHKQALDLIFKHRLNHQAQIRQYVESLIQQEPSLTYDINPPWMGFSLREWQDSPRHGGASGDNICWILYFEFINKPNGLLLELKIGPGGNDLERKKYLEMAQKNKFIGYSSRLTGKWPRISWISFLSASDYEKTQEELETIISQKWDEFLGGELPLIVEAVRQEAWLWTLP